MILILICCFVETKDFSLVYVLLCRPTCTSAQHSNAYFPALDRIIIFYLAKINNDFNVHIFSLLDKLISF
jgi:hypothetical protein